MRDNSRYLQMLMNMSAFNTVDCIELLYVCVYFSASEKSPIPKDRFEEVLDAASLERPTKKSPTKIRGKGKALYSFRAQNPRYAISIMCTYCTLNSSACVHIPCTQHNTTQNSIFVHSMLRIQHILQAYSCTCLKLP